VAVTVEVLGREAELAALSAFLDRVKSGPEALVLAGAAGAGKTTLLRAGAESAAERGFTVVQTLPVRSELPLAFAGLTDLLEQHLESVIGELPAPQARALEIALLLAEASPRPPEPRVIAAGFRSAVAALARAAPVLLVIDDVQWLDRPSQAAVGFAVRRWRDEPVGLLCAQRTSHPGEELPLELARARLRAGLVPVGGLSVGALHRLLTGRLGTAFSRLALRRIQAASGGNPFIALEIGRALERRGLTCTLPAALPVPGTVSGLVGERLAELPPVVLDAVRLVAVMPDAPVARYLAAGASGAELDAAVLAGVLEPEGGRLRFSHPLLASAVAASIPPARLGELHLLAARHAPLAEERARHRALAADGPSAAVAADLDTAARAAAARGAPAIAAELSGLAASLTPAADASAGFRRRLDAAFQLALAGEVRAAVASLEQLTATMPAGPGRSEAMRQLGLLLEHDYRRATGLMEQALAEAGDDPARTSVIQMDLADIWSIRGDPGRAVACARQGHAGAERVGDPALLASALARLFELAWIHGAGVDERQLDRALELEREAGRLLLATPPSWVAGWYALSQGRLAAAETLLRQMLGRAETEGVEYWRAHVLSRLSRIALLRGDPAGAAGLAEEGLAIAEQLDMPHTTSALLYAFGLVAVHQGQAGPVRDLSGRGAELSRRIGDAAYVVLHQALPGSLDLALGDYPAAAARLGPLASRLLDLGPRRLGTGSVVQDAVEALTAAGDLDAAAGLTERLARCQGGPVTAALAARGQGALAAARDDMEAAAAALQDALRWHDQVSPMPLERGRTLLALGAVQRRRKQRAVARATLNEALRLFETAGAQLWAERAQAEQARVSGRAPGPRELTETEQRVAALVARGLSNRQVAAELFVTVRAVESTLTKAYAKLGIQSRTQLAARLHQGG
jgi:DNA-binding CsgD family transcriptional regulator